jgi:hypothetical protein
MDLSKLINILFNDSSNDSSNIPNITDEYQKSKNDDEFIDLELGKTNKPENSHITIHHQNEHSYKVTYGYLVTNYNFKYNNK